MTDLGHTTQKLVSPIFALVETFIEQHLGHGVNDSIVHDVANLVIEADHQSRVDSWFLSERKKWNSVISVVEKLKAISEDSRFLENACWTISPYLKPFAEQIRDLEIPPKPFEDRFRFWTPLEDDDKGGGFDHRENILLAAGMNQFVEAGGTRKYFEELLGALSGDQELKSLGFSLHKKTADQINRSSNRIRHDLSNKTAIFGTWSWCDMRVSKNPPQGGYDIWFMFFGSKDRLITMVSEHLRPRRY